MSRRVIARRSLAACLALFVLLAAAAPALAAGRSGAAEPAGLVAQWIDWMAEVWSSATGLLAPPEGTGFRDGGCILDPDGRCHGAAAPPAGESE